MSMFAWENWSRRSDFDRSGTSAVLRLCRIIPVDSLQTGENSRKDFSDSFKRQFFLDFRWHRACSRNSSSHRIVWNSLFRLGSTKGKKQMGRKNSSSLLVLGLVLFFAAVVHTQGPRYTKWSALEPVTAVNTPGVELAPAVTHDGLSLYFLRNGDIYVSHRPDRNADWEPPVALPAPINLPGNIIDSTPFESTDGHWLYFSSTRPGGVGGSDIWVSYREFVHDDDAWEEPVNLSGVNSVGFEGGPMLFDDEESGFTQLYFAAAPFPGGTQPMADIYVSTLGPDGFQNPDPVAELNSAATDAKPWVRRDGLEMFFASYREGLPAPMTLGSIYSSTRWSTGQPWSEPTIALGRTNPGNPGDRWITTPSLSHDSLTLFVAANQPGTDIGDIYVAYRQKANGKK